MKPTPFLRCIAIIAVIALMPFASFAYDFMVDGIAYNKLTENTVEVTKNVPNGNSTYSGDIKIPESVRYENVDYQVTSIGKNAFYFSENLSGVTIPSSVTSIGSGVFERCIGLERLEVSSENKVFDSRGNCNAIIETETNILLRGCKNTIIPNTITTIGYLAFSDCEELTNIIIPNSVTVIESCAFDGSGLTAVDLPNELKTLGAQAFACCFNLRCIIIPKSVTDIQINPFESCPNLESIIVEEGNPVYNSNGNCNAIIETSTNTLWQGCKNTVIPSSVTHICDMAFSNCTYLEKINIPNSVVEIGQNAFYYCEYVSELTVGESVKSIRNGAFDRLKGLKTVNCLNPVPPTCDAEAFGGTPIANCVLYVPKGSIDAYKNAEVWSGFKSIQAYHSPDEPDTDVSQIDNAIYMDKAESRPGTTIELPLKMKNTASIVGFQCDFVAPDNTSVPTDENGDYRIALSTERTTEKKTNIFATGLQTDGSIRILASSTKNTPFSGNDGVVATVSLHIDKDIQAGEYPVALRNVVVTDGNGTTYSTEYVKTTLTVTITPGDVNGDDKINVGDIAMVSNYIMGISQPAFIKQAADINGDGDINVGDLSSIVELIIGGAPAMAPVQKTSANTRSGASETTHDKSIYAEDATFADGSATLSVQMKDDVDVVSYQFDIELPAGIEVPKDEDDYYLIDLSTKRTTARKHNIFESGLQTDGSIRVLCASATNAIFTGDEGEICTITLNRSDNLAPGNYTVKLKNIVIASKESTGIQTYYLENTTATIVVPGEVNDAGNATELKSGANKVNFALQGVKWHGGILYACSVAESVEKSEPTTSSVDMDRYEDRNYAEFEQRDWVAIGGVDSEYEGMELSAGFVAEYADGVLTPSESIAKTPASSSYVPNTYRTENILHGGYANYSADDYKAYYVPVKENEVARFMGYVETVNGAKYLYSNNANGRIGVEGVKIDGQIADNPCDDFRNDYSLLEGILVSDATTKAGVKIIMLTDLGKATGVETVDASSVRIYSTAGNIVLVAASEGSAQIFDYSGRLLRQIPIEAGCSYSVPVQPGFYLVKVGSTVTLVCVK